MSREETLTLAAQAGADEKTLDLLRDANRVSRKGSIRLPKGQYDHLSRGRGWCRLGKGSSATWAKDDGDCWIVDRPGTWTVGSTDGFSRKKNETWTVIFVQVGEETWTIAN